ncbi:DUF4783 domain-containing protein [uncultured Sunxiuqinia sp.]|uniref:DUF4783 domain-containing protein n=1 Tax=uncultured Sunxiuqinia sp. TaxID=1573825 RepID=UPI002AA7267E|nr:DUF4783 domain-containing protein [uncultured Sunxiuqinia sp.]
MENQSIKTIILGLVFTIATIASFAQVPDEVILSLKTGNASTLSNYFNDNIELVVLEKEDVYSKDQAKQIVANFFSANTAQRFAIIHQGGKEGARYAIGNLTTQSGVYRVYFLLKEKGSQVYIHQLRIEKQ